MKEIRRHQYREEQRIAGKTGMDAQTPSARVRPNRVRAANELAGRFFPVALRITCVLALDRKSGLSVTMRNTTIGRIKGLEIFGMLLRLLWGIQRWNWSQGT